MLKYGSLNNVTNQTSKTLIPRNLTYKSVLNTSSINITNNSNSNANNSTDTTQTSINATTGTITDLSVSTISALSNVNNIVCNGAIAFSVLKSEYISHDFKSYPILFTRDIAIENKNVILNTETLTIKDNVLLINNQVKNNSFVNNTSDVFISGFIFPIIDQNSSTGYYSGLLYLPNNKIEKVSSISTEYKWTTNKYLLFRDTNKGFYKLKYLSQDNSFSTYQNNMTSTYVDLFDNNDNLSNLIVNSIGITDGELVAFNNEFLNIMLGDQDNVPINVVTFNKTNLTLNNNIDIVFDSSLTIKTTTEIINFTDLMTTFYTNILFNKSASIVNFTNTLQINSNDQTYMLFDNINNRIEFSKDVVINTLIILNNLELNFKDLYFGSELNIGSNVNNIFVPYLNFTNTSTNQSLNLLANTYVNNLFINTNLTFKSIANLTFENILYFNSTTETFFNLSSVDRTINLIRPVNVSEINITSIASLKNEIPIKVENNFSVVDKFNNTLINFYATYAKFFYNIYINKVNPKITFDNISTLEISTLNPDIKLQIKKDKIEISGPSNSFSTNLNVIVGSSLNIVNTSCTFNSGLNIFTFVPTSKLYVLSGATKPTENITFVFQNVFSFNENTTQFSGKLNITSRAMDGNFICIYDINIWSTPNGTIEYNTITPINTNLLGDWSLSNFILTDTGDYYNISINCNGSPNYNLIWGLKLDGLSI